MLDVDSGRHSVSSLTSIVSTTSSLDGDGAGSGRKSDVRGRSPSGSVVPDLNVDEALERVGFGAFHLRLTLVAGCFWAADSMQLLLLVLLSPSFACEWNLSESKAAAVIIAVFGSMAVGSIFWGNLADRRGRRVALLSQCTLSVVAGLCSAVAPSFQVMLVSQCLVGLAAGGAHVALALYCECLPPSTRGWHTVSLSYGFALGGVLQTICALVVLPAFDWRWLVALTSVLSIVPLLLSPCLPESPRFYVAAGSMSRARQSLASIATMNRVAVPSVARPAPLRAVVAGTDRGADRGGVTARQREQQLRASLGRFSDVCRRGMGRYTFPLAAVWIGVSVAYMWQMFLASSLLGSARLSETCVSAVAEDSSVPTGAWSKRETCDTVSRNDLWEVFIYAMAEIPGVLLMTVFIAKMDRRRTLAVSTAAAGLCLLALFGCVGRTFELSVLFTARALAACAYQTVFVYTRDVFPSSLRSTAVGVLNAIGRAVCMLLPPAAFVMVNYHVAVSIVGAAAWCAVTGVMVSLLPRDWFAVSAGDTIGDATALGRHRAGPHVGGQPSRRRGSVQMHAYSRVTALAEHPAHDGVNGHADDDQAGRGRSDSHHSAGSGRQLLGGDGRGASGAVGATSRGDDEFGLPSSDEESDGGGEDHHSAIAEVKRVRKLLQQAGSPPPPSIVWELSQRLKRAAGQRALEGGEAYEMLTEEAVRLRLMFRQLKKAEKRAARARQ